MNEWYAKDTSKKIKAVFKARMRDGKRVSGAVPYGYYRKPEDKQTLYVDEVSASVVRRIFQLACEGMGATAIADTLSEDKVLIPSAYARQNHPEDCQCTRYHDAYTWNATTVGYILSRREYLGHTILGKTAKDSFKTKRKRVVNEDELLIFYNTHEAIIDQETYVRSMDCLLMLNRSMVVQVMQRMAEEGKICRIIVKDLSRFGREQVEAGRLTQIVYPSLGITFISIQENVNSTTGDGMEMLPFYNIFNEWYAAQTSKKIRAVWQSKAEHGKRVSATVPFGYMKDPTNKEQWIIDEPAANIVRKIYSLCLAGRGPLQIAKQLEKENVLIPSAYYESIGRKHA